MSASVSVGVVAVALVALPSSMRPCTVPHLLEPSKLVDGAALIVRAVPVEYVVPPDGEWLTKGTPPSTIRFRVVEVLKGSAAVREIVLHGYLGERDDFNDRPAPYDFVRPGGRGGACIASTYRQGAEHLLFLPAPDSDTPLWAPLAPVNEQLDGRDDRWLRWVRQHLSPSTAGPPPDAH
jgi:hypothetical protein